MQRDDHLPGRHIEPMSAAEQFEQAYAQVRSLAATLLARGGAQVTLQPTVLVHEAYVKLAEGGAAANGRAHLLALAARAMRQVLVDHARTVAAAKRGGQWRRVTLSGLDPAADAGLRDIELLALHEALEELAAEGQRQADVVTLRFFGGLEMSEIAEVVGVSKSTVEIDWRAARAWLAVRLDKDRARS